MNILERVYGLYAFITQKLKGGKNKLKNACVNVFLPTTPNPTSGFMLFVPKKDLIRLDMNIEEGMKLVISGALLLLLLEKNKS